MEQGTHLFTAHLSTQIANTFSNCTTSGVHVTRISVPPGQQPPPTEPIFRQNKFVANYHGAVSASGAQPDFGTATDEGYNSFLDSTVRCLWNRTSSIFLTAKGNYWDAPCPDSTEVLLCVVNSHYFPSLCLDPLGFSGPDLDVEPVQAQVNHLTSLTGPIVRQEAVFLVTREPNRSWTLLRIFDVLGRLKSEIPLRDPSAETERVTWSASDRGQGALPAGIYFAALSDGREKSQALRFVVLREWGPR